MCGGLDRVQVGVSNIQLTSEENKKNVLLHRSFTLIVSTTSPIASSIALIMAAKDSKIKLNLKSEYFQPYP